MQIIFLLLDEHWNHTPVTYAAETILVTIFSFASFLSIIFLFRLSELRGWVGPEIFTYSNMLPMRDPLYMLMSVNYRESALTARCFSCWFYSTTTYLFSASEAEVGGIITGKINSNTVLSTDACSHSYSECWHISLEGLSYFHFSF